ncbi:hypothetical protein OHR68_43325 [Spirillospora sp. NBC_00431]
MINKDRASGESCEGPPDARQGGPAGTRPEARPAGPLARLLQLADGWDEWAAEAGTAAGLLAGAAQPTDVWYLHGQAAGRADCAVQLRALLAALERNNERGA